ncbi:DUF4959 domain-containing protein [Maribellus sp. CM-23]|uniref:DUF4959 domain-containing protein n=1 Tax=Maribellus sp. CM-23 TaxID=2781026 RepID=UPI001F41E23B|nr:DUF4959 domain-containing protein [Maribellus sp. CM-23]MCE4566412.1 DUF4959 domain-containing protein [Maribellus sp. CM-23]
MKSIKINTKIFSNIVILILVTVVLFTGCNDYLAPEPYVKNPEVPPALQSTNVTNISGGAKIEFELPKGVDDLLYVKASYLRNGKTVETKASRYDNSLYVQGLRDTSKTVEVELVVGNNSGKESAPTFVQVKPLAASIDVAVKTMLVEETFGGVRLRWDNPTLAATIVKVYSVGVTEFGGDSVLTEVFSEDTKLIRPDYKIRGEIIGGYDSIPTQFGFQFKDIFGNQTDTIFLIKTPIYERYLQPVATGIFPFKGISVHSATLAAQDPTLTWDGPNWGDRASYKLWDGKWNTNPDAYWAVAHDVNNLGGEEAFKNKKSAFVTIDLQQPSKLSRYKLYGLKNKQYVYNESAPRKWRIWVTPDLTEEEAKNWGPDSNWEVAHDFTVPAPLDGKIAHDVTDSDYKTWNMGWEHDLSIQVTYPVRFLRLEVYEAWTSAVGGGATGELEVYGAPE